MRYRRPLWRSFTDRFLANAVRHVRNGGHALLWRRAAHQATAWILLPCGENGEISELGFWSLLTLDKKQYDVVARGAARGLATVRVPRALEWAVEEWCERDAKWRGTTRDVELDCLACAACCRRNRVVLTEQDGERWRAAGRADLEGKAYTRKSNGEVVLRLQNSGDCVHLRGNACGIYEVRPDNCDMFPPASECCLAAREEELGLDD